MQIHGVGRRELSKVHPRVVNQTLLILINRHRRRRVTRYNIHRTFTHARLRDRALDVRRQINKVCPAQRHAQINRSVVKHHGALRVGRRRAPHRARARRRVFFRALPRALHARGRRERRRGVHREAHSAEGAWCG